MPSVGRACVRLAFATALVLSALSLSSQAAEKELWLEAESFDTLGGWVIDQQSMDQMGSA